MTTKRISKKKKVVVVGAGFCLFLSLAYITANVYFNNNMAGVSQHSGMDIDKARKEATKIKF
jgi:hypothetical protein